MFLLVALVYNVNAFGISSPYWSDNPLYVSPGETKDVVMSLQNMVGGGDTSVTAEVNSGKNILTITDKNKIYNVPFGSSNVPIHLRITVPADAKPKQEWQVGVSFKTIAPNTGGVSIGTGVDEGFKVIVKEKPKVSGKATKQIISSQLAGFLILVIILIILSLTIKHFHKKRDNK